MDLILQLMKICEIKNLQNLNFTLTKTVKLPDSLN